MWAHSTYSVAKSAHFANQVRIWAQTLSGHLNFFVTLLKKVFIVICHYGIGMVTKVFPLDYKIKSDWIKQVKNMGATFLSYSCRSIYLCVSLFGDVWKCVSSHCVSAQCVSASSVWLFHGRPPTRANIAQCLVGFNAITRTNRTAALLPNCIWFWP